MARPRKRRCCRRYRADRIYKPQGIPLREIDNTVLSLDEFEALRLCDYERLDQEAAGERIGVSRGTVQRLLYSARRHIVEAILNGDAIIINLKESEDYDESMYSHPGGQRIRRHRI
jgi:predicted DNA-binding protein (UPF0251 family)